MTEIVIKNSDTVSDALEQRDFLPFAPRLEGPEFDGFVGDVLAEVHLRIMAKRLVRAQAREGIVQMLRPLQEPRAQQAKKVASGR